MGKGVQLKRISWCDTPLRVDPSEPSLPTPTALTDTEAGAGGAGLSRTMTASTMERWATAKDQVDESSFQGCLQSG